MVSLRKYKFELLVGVAIILLYFLTRFYNILELPIFTDEAIYIRWAQIANQDANWRFISLTDGKQPSFVWITIIFLRVFSDPLLAGRAVSIFAGLGTMIGLFFLALELFKSKKIALLTSFLYVIYPFALVYDRMALYESLTAMFFVWAIYLSILLVRLLRLDVALILGLVLGGGVLTKTSGFLPIYLLPLNLFLFDWREHMRNLRLVKLAGLFFVSAILAYGFYGILRLSPYFHIISEKNTIFVYPLSEWVKHPVEFFIGNLRALIDWFLGYMSIPVFIFAPLAFIFTKNTLEFKRVFSSTIISKLLPIYIVLSAGLLLVLYFLRENRDPYHSTLPFALFGLFVIAFSAAVFNNREKLFEKLYLVVWFIVPLCGLALFGNNLYPRFVFFMSLSLLPLISYSAINIGIQLGKRVQYGAIFLIFSIFIYKSYFIIFDFSHSPVTYSDVRQYSTDWPGGGGVKEAVEFLKKESEKGKIFVATQGTFGLLPYALEIYLSNNPNIKIQGFWPLKDEIPQELLEMSRIMPTYIAFYQPCGICSYEGIAPVAWPLIKILQVDKGKSYFTLYRVNPR